MANHVHSYWRDMAGDFGIPLKKWSFPGGPTGRGPWAWRWRWPSSP